MTNEPSSMLENTMVRLIIRTIRRLMSTILQGFNKYTTTFTLFTVFISMTHAPRPVTEILMTDVTFIRKVICVSSLMLF